MGEPSSEAAVCVVCREPQDDGNSIALECGHRFHPGCILQWFRSGNSTCPLCREHPTEIVNFLDTRARYSILRRMSRNRSAPPALRQAVERLRRVEGRITEATRSSTSHAREHRTVIQRHRQNQRRCGGCGGRHGCFSAR